MTNNRRTYITNLAKIIIGALLQAVAYVLFISPHKIVPGGVYGISIVIHHLTVGLFNFAPDGLPIGIVALLFNFPILLLATKVLGLQSGGKTVITFVSIATFTDIITSLSGGQMLVDDALLSCFYGGVILGVGVFLTLNANSTSAGTDVIARVISYKLKINLSYSIIVIDSIIVLFGLFAFHDISIPLYSWFTIFIYGQAVNLLSRKDPNCLMIVIAEDISKIKDFILYEIHRGGTYFTAKGLYTDNDKKILFLVVSAREAIAVENRIKAFDENIFIVTTDAHDIHGNGYSSDPKWNYKKFR